MKADQGSSHRPFVYLLVFFAGTQFAVFAALLIRDRPQPNPLEISGLLILEFLLPLIACATGVWIIAAPSWRRCARNVRLDLFFGYQAIAWFSGVTFGNNFMASASTGHAVLSSFFVQWSAFGVGLWYAITGLPLLAAYLILRALPAARRQAGREELFP